MRRALFIFAVVVLLPQAVLAKPGDVVSKTPSPGPCPTGLTFDGKSLWVADRKADQLYRIDPEDGAIVSHIPSPGFWPMGLAWDGRYLWNVDSEKRQIFQIDPESGLIVRTVESPVSNPMGLTWDGQYLWVSDYRKGKIDRISPQDGTTIVSIQAPTQNPQGLAYDGTYLWVSDRIKNEIYMVWPENGAVLFFFDSPGPYAWGLAYDGSYLWNGDYEENILSQLVIRDGEHYAVSDERYAEVEFTHQLKNFGTGFVQRADFYFAIPKDCESQKLEGEIEFDPQPIEMLTDRWNQELAHFVFEDIAPGQIVSPSMKVTARIYDIRYFIFPDQVGSLADIPEELKEMYLVDEDKYAINDPYIQQTVKEVVGDESSPYWIVRKIFDHIRTHMRYELAGGWNVAPTVLKRGTGSCSEYTFVFISMCRAAGVPARYVGSVVVRGDDASYDQYFHRWAQVYLPNYGWIHWDAQGGDKDLPRDQADSIGHLSNRFLLTTFGGGNSEYLEWSYDSNVFWTAEPRAEVHFENIAEWRPLKRGETESVSPEGKCECTFRRVRM
ncbi:MAG: transglutaminase domain-containing protein [bacterium]